VSYEIDAAKTYFQQAKKTTAIPDIAALKKLCAEIPDISTIKQLIVEQTTIKPNCQCAALKKEIADMKAKCDCAVIEDEIAHLTERINNVEDDMDELRRDEPEPDKNQSEPPNNPYKSPLPTRFQTARDHFAKEEQKEIMGNIYKNLGRFANQSPQVTIHNEDYTQVTINQFYDAFVSMARIYGIPIVRRDDLQRLRNTVPPDVQRDWPEADRTAIAQHNCTPNYYK
jgi:hypothetical protein